MRAGSGRETRGRGQTAKDAHRRRGAIAVMTAVFIVVIMLVTAVSIDASRIFIAKNELQTAADAAALAGAVQLLEDSSTASDSAGSYAARNRVGADSILTVDISPGVWHPADRHFELAGPPWNAVRVVTSHSLPLSLARVLGDSAVTVTASAVAWSSGPVSESPCAKPIAVPYSELLRSLGYPEGFDFDLTDDDVRRLREMPEADRYAHFHYADKALGDTLGGHYESAQYFPVDIDSTWHKSDPLTHSRPEVSSQSFQSYVVGPPGGQCSRSVSPNDEVRAEPGNKASALRDGLSEICTSLGGVLTGDPVMTCEPTIGGPAIYLPLKVIFWAGDAANWDGNGNRAVLRARTTGSFLLREFKWDPDDPSGRGQHARMAGYWSVNRDFGPISASSASMLVRPILVR